MINGIVLSAVIVDMSEQVAIEINRQLSQINQSNRPGIEAMYYCETAASQKKRELIPVIGNGFCSELD